MHVIDHSLARPSAAAAASVPGSPQAAACAPGRIEWGSATAPPPPPGQITTTALARGEGESSSVWELPQNAAPAQSRWLPILLPSV